MTDDSIRGLEEAVGAAPGDTGLKRRLAAALEAAGRYAEALAQLDAVVDAAAEDAPALVAQARCLFELGRYLEALERYDRALGFDLGVADAALRERIVRAQADPRARIRLVADGSPAAKTPELKRSPDQLPARITFADVGGLEELKEKIRLSILYPLERPDLYRAFGKKVGGGLLFYGPPGCGKTFLARATAGEAGIHFVCVGIEEVLDMWLGQSEKRLHELFESARQQAPAILFFDEVDALGGRRSGLRHESYRTLVTQFLSELDGVGGRAAGVLVLGATNAPWDVDPAFRRPGRFGDVLFVPPPDLRARVEILRLKLAGKPLGRVDLAEVARATELFSGADLEQVVDRAVEVKLAASLRGGAIEPLVSADLLGAVSRSRPSTLEWFAAAKNFAAYANEAGNYDEVVQYLARHHLT